MSEEKSYKKAFDYSIRLLSLRDYSIYKMRQKLKERKFDADDIEIVINKLLEYNYLREDEYKRIRIKQLLVKGYANNYIIQKLEQEQLFVDDSNINEIRDTQDLGSSKQIQYLIEKKLRFKEIPSEWEAKQKLKNKVINFLISKGYKYADVQSYIKEYIS